MSGWMRYGYILSLMLCTGGTAEAATDEVLPALSAFVEAARTSSVESKSNVVELELANANVGRAWASLAPRLSVTGNLARNEFDQTLTVPEVADASGPRVFVAENQRELELELVVPLIAAGQWTRIAAERRLRDAQRWRSQARENEIELLVTQAYYDFVGQSQLLRAVRRSLDATAERVRRLESRLASGLASELDLDQAKAQEAASVQVVAAVEADVAQSARQLKTLTGIDPRAYVATGLESDVEDVGSADYWLSRIGSNPSVETEKATLEYRERAVAAAWLDLTPDVEAFARQSLTNAPGFAPERNVWALGASATWSLDPTRFSDIALAQDRASLARLQLRRAADERRDAVEDAVLRLKASAQRVIAAGTEERASRRALESTLQGNRAGRNTQLDVVLAERDLLEAQGSRIQALAEYAYLKRVLELESGRSWAERRP
ncbi:MAG: TolC family protein [Myxococcota bacterium]